MLSIKNAITNNCAIIILAAGSSSRLGRPKQLLPYNGKSLLEHAVDTANESEANPVIVVIGANAALLKKEIAEKISKKENQKLVDFVTDLNIRKNGLEGISDQEEVLRIMAKFVLMVLEHDRRTHLHEDSN